MNDKTINVNIDNNQFCKAAYTYSFMSNPNSRPVVSFVNLALLCVFTTRLFQDFYMHELDIFCSTGGSLYLDVCIVMLD